MLTAGVIGLPLTGKTTVFNLATNAGAQTSNFLSGKTETNVAMAVVPDRRVDFLSQMYQPKRTIHAQVQFSDVPGLVQGSSQGKGVGNQFLDGIRNADLLVHVIRAFNNSEVDHVEGDLNPLRDIETISMELLFADMELVEKRISRIKGGKKITKENQAELEIMEKIYACLEQEIPLSQSGLTEAEWALLVNYSFLTDKKMIWVINTDEEQFKSGNYPYKAEVEALAAEKGIKCIEVCGLMEAEISELEDEDKELFMADLGIEQLGVERLSLAVYETLNLISFFTVGEDEVKAWTIEIGDDAKRAAGKIHSDIERGFIRAEVVSYTDLVEYKTMAEVKNKGLNRLEGKEYIMQDGDIVNFRFNV